MALAPKGIDRPVPDRAIDRYTVLRIRNGIAPGALAAHFYDLGPERGLRLVGIERPYP